MNTGLHSRNRIAVALVAVVLIASVGVVTAAVAMSAKPTEDRYSPSNSRWFDRTIENSENYHQYSTIQAGVRASDVILLGHITGARPTRVIHGEVSTDIVRYGGYVVDVDRLIAGDLTDRGATSVVVELSSQDYGDPERVGAEAPKGQALWLLRSNKKTVDAQMNQLRKSGNSTAQAERDARAAEPFCQPVGLYQGVIMQGEHHVDSPFDPDANSGLGAEAAKYARLSSLVDHIDSIS